MSTTRKRNKNLTPLPAGVAVGDTIAYYSRGWHYGRLEQVKGNKAGIHIPAVYGAKEAEAQLKWVLVSDIKAVD